MIALISFVVLVGPPDGEANQVDPIQVFDQTIQIVNDSFYDRTFRGFPWWQWVSETRQKVSANTGDDELKIIVNGLLSRLKASHTEFLSDTDQEYYVLKSVFSGKISGYRVSQIGVWFKRVGAQWFVWNCFSGSVAERSGIRAGDEILSVDNESFDPVKSLTALSRKAVTLNIRSAPDESPRRIRLKPEYKSFQEMLLRSAKLSARVYNFQKKRIGYFHLWAGTHDQFRLALRFSVRKMKETTDVLILDLRDGFGGANPQYVEPFFNKDENGKPITPIYTKPVVVLINEGTRSGKEWVAYLLKESRRAILVGETTMGYFLGGQVFDIVPGRFALYLAVRDNSPEGVDLEGKGVRPNVVVSMRVPYSRGADPQLERAFEVAVDLVKQADKSRDAGVGPP